MLRLLRVACLLLLLACGDADQQPGGNGAVGGHGGGGAPPVDPPNEPPVAELEIALTPGTPGEVTLDGSASSDADGEIVSFAWTFDDAPTRAS